MQKLICLIKTNKKSDVTRTQAIIIFLATLLLIRSYMTIVFLKIIIFKHICLSYICQKSDIKNPYKECLEKSYSL